MTVALSRADVVSDLPMQVCTRHWRTATFAVVTEHPEGPERELVCDQCLPDVMRAAAEVRSFVPHTVHPVTPDTWEVAA